MYLKSILACFEVISRFSFSFAPLSTLNTGALPYPARAY